MRVGPSLIVLVMGVALAGQAMSIDQPVLTDTFETYPPGVLTTSGGWSDVDPSSLKTKRKIEVVVDTGNLLGGGTTNQVLRFYNIASDPVTFASSFTANGLSTGQVLMVRFEFHEPSATAGGLHVSVGGDPTAANTVNAFELTDGALGPAGSYSLNTPHQLAAVFNETGAMLNYQDPAGGVSALATGAMDIWIDQVRVAAGVSQGRAPSPSPQLSSVHFRNADSQQDIYLENVEILTGGTPVDPPDPTDDLLITNLQVASGTTRIEWDPMSDRLIVMSSQQLEGIQTHGLTVASTTTFTNAASFGVGDPTRFVHLMNGIAAVDGITSPALWDEVKAQSTVTAPTNRIYDVEVNGIVGLTLPAQAFALTELDGFSRLDKLSLAGSGITQLDDLAPLTGLTWLNLSDNLLTDVTGLSVLTSLEALHLDGNQINDLSGLEGLIHLRWLDLENNLVTDLAPVVTNAANGGLGEGDELWVRGNPLSATATNQIQILETTYNVRVFYQ